MVKSFYFFTTLALLLFGTAFTAIGQNKPCIFEATTLQFVGTPREQARCLLRPNKIGGKLDKPLAMLPKPFEELMGARVKFKKEKLESFLLKNKIDQNLVGGSIDEPLSKAKLPNGQEIQALYFIIHDTSTPYLKDDVFAINFDTDSSWKGNNLNIWTNQPVAHVFINRLGASFTATSFNETVKKGWGTKFARDFLKSDGKGLEIHIELVQPRRRDPNHSNPDNDRIAPIPGFTPNQYERLALLYICASVRRGTWLIPAYHSAVDAGIKDAHDDPQNFELNRFASVLKSLIKRID